MKETLLKLLEEIRDNCDEAVFYSQSKFRSVILDLSVDKTESRRAYNLMSIAIFNIKGYSRLRKAAGKDKFLVVQLIKELIDDYLIEGESAQIAIEAIDEFLKQKKTIDKFITNKPIFEEIETLQPLDFTPKKKPAATISQKAIISQKSASLVSPSVVAPSAVSTPLPEALHASEAPQISLTSQISQNNREKWVSHVETATQLFESLKIEFKSCVNTLFDGCLENMVSVMGENYLDNKYWSVASKRMKATRVGMEEDIHFEGDIVNGYPHGVGVIKWKTDNIYVGEFKRGVIHGQGRFISAMGYYEGEFMYNDICGKGYLASADDSISYGYWIRGKLAKVLTKREWDKLTP